MITLYFILNSLKKETLSVHKSSVPPLDFDKISQASNWIKNSNRVVFFTGAGMSAASGIPTYRGKFGLWVMSKDLLIIIIALWGLWILTFIFSSFISFKVFILSYFLFVILLILGIIVPYAGAIALSTPFGWKRFPVISWIIFKIFFFDKVVRAKLNDGHKFMQFLPTVNISVMIVTANVDCLESKVSGHVYQLHGRIDKFCCLNCGSIRTLPLTETLPWVPPKCHCGKRKFRTGCLLFAEDGSNRLRMDKVYSIEFDKDDVAIVIGSSGVISCGYNLIRQNTRTIEINLTPESPTQSWKYTENYLYIQGYQEKILNEIKKGWGML